MRELIGLTFCVQLLLTIGLSEAWAGPCVSPPLSAEVITQFKSNPGALIVPNSDTRTVEALVRDLAGTDATLAAEIIHVAQGTAPRFRTAIAAGLAQAAIACSTADQNAALVIQQAVAAFQDGEFQSAFAAVAGDLSTAAAGVASESAAGSVGSVVVTNPSGSRPASTNPGGGGTPAFFQIASPGALIPSIARGAQSATTTAANPVSATR
jgi:hypothetical protein